MADAAGDVLVQAEADDAVIAGMERPERVFAQDRAAGRPGRGSCPSPGHVNQRHLAGEPNGQLDSDPAACGCHHRPGDVSDMVEKTGQGTWLGVPALSQLASCGATSSRIATAGRRKITAMPVIITMIR